MNNKNSSATGRERNQTQMPSGSPGTSCCHVCTRTLPLADKKSNRMWLMRHNQLSHKIGICQCELHGHVMYSCAVGLLSSGTPWGYHCTTGQTRGLQKELKWKYMIRMRHRNRAGEKRSKHKIFVVTAQLVNIAKCAIGVVHTADLSVESTQISVRNTHVFCTNPQRKTHRIKWHVPYFCAYFVREKSAVWTAQLGIPF